MRCSRSRMTSCVTSITKKHPSGVFTSTRLTPSQKLFSKPGGWKWMRTSSPEVIPVAASLIRRRSTSLRQALYCPHGRLGAIGRADLAHDGFDVNLNGGFRNVELARDRLVGRTIHKTTQDFRLADRERPCPWTTRL